MSDCGCKGGSVAPQIQQVDSTTSIQIKNYALKIIFFLGVMVLMPVIVVGIIVLLFKHIVLNKGVDLMPAFRKLVNKYAAEPEEEDEEEEEEWEEIEEEEYELMDVEVIK